jgi:hypothetical protein
MMIERKMLKLTSLPTMNSVGRGALEFFSGEACGARLVTVEFQSDDGM